MKLVVFDNRKFYLSGFTPLKVYCCDPVNPNRKTNEVLAYDECGEQVFLLGTRNGMYAIFGD